MNEKKRQRTDQPRIVRRDVSYDGGETWFPYDQRLDEAAKLPPRLERVEYEAR